MSGRKLFDLIQDDNDLVVAAIRLNITQYVAIYRMKNTELSPIGLPFPIFVKACISKGAFKILVLSILQTKAMHGYDIAKTIQERSHGLYKPSPGSIYPTLKSLHEKGYVRIVREGERKIYHVTPSGKRFLKDRKDQIIECMHEFEKSFGPEQQKLMSEMKKTGKLIAVAGKDLTPEQVNEIAELVKDMREKMLKIIAR